ncbi:TadE/TadG family type IV pilus assembly protein [Georgenia ruanii]|uniref:Pilus assembly protein TadE n=1 Tax=Georgenia ruanii TaxID=348442 RepID=A0A7J9UU92_9MICO|nr:TadE/TadG family type IV pilus assembly protein [Georgenia ruanii]MPV87430.1 pilus assembly protein TadE [Georgenia ruanii]
MSGPRVTAVHRPAVAAPRRRRLRGAGSERGSAALEMLGVLPVVVLVALATLQVLAGVYTVHAANQAVRDGARAASLGGSVAAAVDRSLPGTLTPRELSGTGGKVRLVLDVPRMAPFIPELRVTRTAVMP